MAIKTQQKLRIADFMPQDNKLLAGCWEEMSIYIQKLEAHQGEMLFLVKECNTSMFIEIC